MKNVFSFLFMCLLSIGSFAQSANELNEQSKELLQKQEIGKALPILKRAAELGNAEAQYNLGYCYQAGIGVDKSSEGAVEWYAKSAEQGWNDGLYAMMMAYGNGDGVVQDFNKAFSYALKCANNGDGTCMFNVINCYKEGMGTEKDLNKMLEWAIRLGKLENPDNLQKSGYITSARLNLAYIYRDGRDVKQDWYNSYIWFLIYNESKRDFSYLQQQDIIDEIKELEKSLSAEQKKNGKLEAEELIERPLKNLANLYKAEM